MVAAIIRKGKDSTLSTGNRKVIWDNTTKFEKEFQTWWYLVNFTYKTWKLYSYILEKDMYV